MKKKVDKKTNEKQPELVFRPSFDKALFMSDDEQLDTKVFYVDDKDLEFIDKNLK